MTPHFTGAKPLAAADDPNSVAVTAVTHWTPSLFSFQLERPPHFRFRSGEFAMLGLIQQDGRPLLRAYSMASPSWDDQLEFIRLSFRMAH